MVGGNGSVDALNVREGDGVQGKGGRVQQGDQVLEVLVGQRGALVVHLQNPGKQHSTRPPSESL